MQWFRSVATVRPKSRNKTRPAAIPIQSHEGHGVSPHSGRLFGFFTVLDIFSVPGCLAERLGECAAKGEASVELDAWKAEQAAQDAGLGITAGEDEQPVAAAHVEREVGSCEARG